MFSGFGSKHVFGHNVRLQFVVLAAFEAVLCYLSIYLAAAIRFGGFEAAVTAFGGPVWSRAALFSLVMMIGLFSMGLFQTRLREGPVGVLLRIGVACVIGGTASALAYYAIPALYVGRGVHGIAVGLSLLMLSIAHLLFMRLVDEEDFKRKVLVYGTGRKALSLTRLRRRSDRRGFVIAGFVADEGDEQQVDAARILEIGDSLATYSKENDIVEIVVAVDDRRQSLPIRPLLECRLMGIEVTEVLTFFERETGRVYLDLLYPSWIIYSKGFARNPRRALIKRSFDILTSALLLALLWPVMLLTAVAVKLEDGLRAPVFYKQQRVGLDSEIFEVLKFRSMRVDAEREASPEWAQKNDPRVTRVGNVIRKLRIDELPQLLNVLAGDMAFVGPRPERPEFVGDFAERIPYYNERHCVKPGITGWAQLSFPYGSSENDTIEKLQFDLYYLKNHSLLFDLQILMQTVEVVLFGKGAR